MGFNEVTNQGHYVDEKNRLWKYVVTNLQDNLPPTLYVSRFEGGDLLTCLVEDENQIENIIERHAKKH